MLLLWFTASKSSQILSSGRKNCFCIVICSIWGFLNPGSGYKSCFYIVICSIWELSKPEIGSWELVFYYYLQHLRALEPWGWSAIVTVPLFFTASESSRSLGSGFQNCFSIVIYSSWELSNPEFGVQEWCFHCNLQHLRFLDPEFWMQSLFLIIIYSIWEFTNPRFGVQELRFIIICNIWELPNPEFMVQLLQSIL